MSEVQRASGTKRDFTAAFHGGKAWLTLSGTGAQMTKEMQQTLHEAKMRADNILFTAVLQVEDIYKEATLGFPPGFVSSMSSDVSSCCKH